MWSFIQAEWVNICAVEDSGESKVLGLDWVVFAQHRRGGLILDCNGECLDWFPVCYWFPVHCVSSW